MLSRSQLVQSYAAFREACGSIQTAVELMREATGSDPFFLLGIASEAVRTRGVLDRVVRRHDIDTLVDAIRAIPSDGHDFDVERKRLLDLIEGTAVAGIKSVTEHAPPPRPLGDGVDRGE